MVILIRLGMDDDHVIDARLLDEIKVGRKGRRRRFVRAGGMIGEAVWLKEVDMSIDELVLCSQSPRSRAKNDFSPVEHRQNYIAQVLKSKVQSLWNEPPTCCASGNL